MTASIFRSRRRRKRERRRSEATAAASPERTPRRIPRGDWRGGILSRSDLQLIGRAALRGWDVPPSLRLILLRQVCRTFDNRPHDVRTILRCATTIINMDWDNLRAERAIWKRCGVFIPCPRWRTDNAGE
jgi:hypothetical protein